MTDSDLDLPPEVWKCIFKYLQRSDLRQLMLVGRALRECVLPQLYEEVVFSEWAGSGLRLAVAIQQHKLSNASVAHIRQVIVVFTSYVEILATLELLASIQPRFTGLEVIRVRSYQTEDCLRAISLLTAGGWVPKRIELEAVVCGPPSQLLALADPNVAAGITRLKIPMILRSCLQRLRNLEELSIARVVHDTDAAVFSVVDTVPRRLNMSHTDWMLLGCPPAAELDLELWGDQKICRIDNPALKELRLVAHCDMPDAIISLHTPCLRILLLCNISPTATVIMLDDAVRNLSLNLVEFLSIGPVTVPVLQFVARTQLPSLKIFMALLTLASLGNLIAKETGRLVQWLQIVATKYPVDVLDFTRKVKRWIYWSDGLWVLTAQGPYRRYLPQVAPPALI